MNDATRKYIDNSLNHFLSSRKRLFDGLGVTIMNMQELMALPENDRSYLGDGLYVGELRGVIWLVAPREGGDHSVALGPDQVSLLDAFLDRPKNSV